MRPTPAQAGARIPRGVWVLGFVSMLMDISSEMIHALLPVYLVTVMGASALTVGVIEGIAEATAAVTKVFSGALSDWLGRRKLLVLLGYALGALTKPVFALAPVVEWLVAARFVDRVGKGIRGAPRDALVADLAPAELRGAAFGLRQALDTVGAFVGPLLAIALMLLTHNHFQTVFWWAVLPAALCVLLVLLGVREPARPAPAAAAAASGDTAAPAHRRFGREQLARLDRAYWWVVGLGALFTLARFSEAFLILRAQAVGLPLAFAPAVLVLMNLVYALAAYPAGALSDRMPRERLLGFGLALLVAADLALALLPHLAGVALGIVLWGLHMALTQGVLAAMVADTAPAELRGTAFGVFNLVSGLGLLAASVLAGALWDQLGAGSTFLVGAACAALSVAALWLRPGRSRR
ncbi:MAG TPA: MFS transporter [Burkholderiaceae bacterium]|nr:MFS transporter [Burkholderiaceae bacterium]